jgi:hypothetical protein
VTPDTAARLGRLVEELRDLSAGDDLSWTLVAVLREAADGVAFVLDAELAFSERPHKAPGSTPTAETGADT